MASTPGQNVHLVASSSHLANSSSQLVVLSSYLVESSSHLVVSLCHYSFILQLVVLPFNSSCRLSTLRATISCTVLGKRGDLRDLGTTTEQSNMAAVEPMDELKEC